MARESINEDTVAGSVIETSCIVVRMTSEPLTTPPSGPVLVKRVVPVIAAAAIATGCAGCPGHVPEVDAYLPVFDAGRSRPDDAFVEVRDAGISVGPIDVGVPPYDSAAIADDAGPVGDDAD